MRRDRCSVKRYVRAAPAPVVGPLDAIGERGGDALSQALDAAQRAVGTDVHLFRIPSPFLLPGARARGEPELDVTKADR